MGFDFYTSGSVPYWTENAYYSFTSAEVDEIEAAANQLHALCLYAVERIVDERLFPLFGIAPEFGELIADSWSRRKEGCLYGRFDLMWGGAATGEAPKMLEYNADTPTSLFEASIVQHYWREEVFGKTADQFNWIHEAITERWAQFLVGRRNTELLYVTCEAKYPEDVTTVQYIGQLAKEAGYRGVKYIPITEIGWRDGEFRDLDELPMRHIFKLYPWEWIIREEFGPNVLRSAATTRWWEPPWKMLLSNKAILPILWEMFPEHPNLLPAYRAPHPVLERTGHVKKPLLGREGHNVAIVAATGEQLVDTGGVYTDSGYIYQAYAAAPMFGSARPNLGVWMVNDYACGMGVREDDSLVISNQSRFVPHIFT